MQKALLSISSSPGQKRFNFGHLPPYEINQPFTWNSVPDGSDRDACSAYPKGRSDIPPRFQCGFSEMLVIWKVVYDFDPSGGNQVIAALKATGRL